MTKSRLIFITLITSLFIACGNKHVPENRNEGRLFIIGGGKRPSTLIGDLISFAQLQEQDYIVVLPMASSEPDTAAFYGVNQFTEQSLIQVYPLNFKEQDNSPAMLDSLANAQLIYITGGDQNKFMDIAKASGVDSIIRHAYKNGACIAGTSAGAAVMSAKMITGNEHKKPEYTGDFNTIEANNIEIKEGLGLMTTGIVDQHFIWRMRMNRLISVALEHPDETAWGIDESTALAIWGDSARVVGEGQVIMLQNPQKNKREKNGLLAGENLQLTVWLTGDRFILP